MAGKEHVITYAFQTKPTLDGQLTGGLPSVIAAELRGREGRSHDDTLVVISDDVAPLALPSMDARVVAAQQPEVPTFDRFDVWFDHNWATLHPKGYMRPFQDTAVLDAMFRGEYEGEEGIARIIKHFEKYGPLVKNPDAVTSFDRRFDQAFSQIEPGSRVSWQDYFFTGSMLKHAPALREKGCYQTFHLHTAVPESLDAFPDGQQMLQAMSLMDEVYVHTDTYKERLEAQMDRLGLPVPKISRFDLGVDQAILDNGLATVNKTNYQEHPRFAQLTADRRQLIEAVFSSQDVIPNRFLSFDRPEPNKGTAQLMLATDQYLANLGMSLEEMRNQYRFFFILPDIEVASDNPYNLKHRYMKDVVAAQAAYLMQKYPGVVYSSHNAPREFIPALLEDTHVMTGGLEDGLNLASQEGLYVNAVRRRDASGIVGRGTGFAMQTLRIPGAQNLVYFTREGNVEDIVGAMRDIVRLRNEAPGTLEQRTRELGERVIFQRRDSVIVR